ncbi:aminoglycoside phosphotransferase family protein [Nocardioides pacificus]
MPSSASPLELIEEWGLRPDGAPVLGHRAQVVPVRTSGGAPAVLKIAVQVDETEHESLALQHWHGRGAVRLLRADPRRRALLLERVHAEDLAEHWDVEACEIVAGLYRTLHVPAVPQLRSLAELAGRWSTELAALPRSTPLPRRLVEQAASLAASFSRDPDTDGVTVHGDLHYAKVLAADREPWVVIAPRPLSGDPHVEPGPLLWHRWDEVRASSDVRDAVRRRFHAVVDAAELDEDRARDWVVVRAVVNAVRDLGAGSDPDLTRWITLAKAVQG